jgi:hypothetical protein
MPELCNDQLNFDGLESARAANGGAGGIRGEVFCRIVVHMRMNS